MRPGRTSLSEERRSRQLQLKTVEIHRSGLRLKNDDRQKKNQRSCCGREFFTGRFAKIAASHHGGPVDLEKGWVRVFRSAYIGFSSFGSICQSLQHQRRWNNHKLSVKNPLIFWSIPSTSQCHPVFNHLRIPRPPIRPGHFQERFRSSV